MIVKQLKVKEWKEKLAKDGRYLKRIKKNQTPELCEIAIRRDPMALEFVNEPTLELCQLAVGISEKALKFVPYNEETKEWFLSYVRERLSILPDLNSQPEILQWEFLKQYPYYAHNLNDATCRIGLEKAKDRMLTSYVWKEEHSQCFEIFYAQVKNGFGGELKHAQLSEDDLRELWLMISPLIFEFPTLSDGLKQKIERKRDEFLSRYYPNLMGDLFEERVSGKEIGIIELIQSEPEALSITNNYNKSYRLCRLAKRLDNEMEWFSPYHALELLMGELKC